ncbi:hypothetical protein D8674_021425 [Pyrus ussuriensis x Pyrus communis]|uniref:Uncharacterized protein n=1 Tax=Pyrus ussuriensis x Pyrus communis TaxID=2448454 RepID=A0A5N5GI87_9ROSA|nr:hypothetical protein D8674_021425 [Pyrus ussuriensis x Pyrus communis]
MENPELCPKWIALLTMEKACDHEVELAVILSQKSHDVPQSTAVDYVVGKFLCGNGYFLQQERVIPVCYFAKEASCSVLKEDVVIEICSVVFFLQEKQEITIEKAMRNKRKCITTVKGLHLFGNRSLCGL